MNHSSNAPREETDPIPAGWERLPAEHMPPPTFWPAGLGLGITLLCWSVITSWVVFVLGLIVFAGSLAGWIVDFLHERGHPHS